MITVNTKKWKNHKLAEVSKRKDTEDRSDERQRKR